MAVDKDWIQSLQRLVEDLLGGPSVAGTQNSLVAGTWGIFTEARPSAKAKDGELIILSSEGGVPPFANIHGIRRYEFEVRTVAPEATPETAEEKANDLYNLLGAQGPQISPDGRIFDFFEILGHVQRDDIDATGHFEYAFSIRTQVRE